MTGPTAASRWMTVLLVEDDEGIALPLVCSLEREGCRVERVTSATDAIACLRQGGIRLVVVDVELADPDIDGLALAHQVGRERLAPALLLLTAEVRRPFGAHPPEGIALMHVAKPFAVREFLARTRILLGTTEPRLPAPRAGGLSVEDRAGS